MISDVGLFWHLMRLTKEESKTDSFLVKESLQKQMEAIIKVLF